MCTRIILLAAVLHSLAGCAIIPESSHSETLTFDSIAPSQAPVSYADLMCCYDCTV